MIDFPANRRRSLPVGNWEYCHKHQVRRAAGVQCWQCAVENAQADRVEAIVETLHIHSHRMDHTFDGLMVLEARIADQAELIELQNSRIANLQRRLAQAEARINRLVERGAE